MFKRFRRRSAQTFNVLSLDGTILTFELESRSTGADVLERVLEASGAQEEKDYFGLVSSSDGEPVWISLRKPLKKQLPGRSPYTVDLRVCMYPRDNQSMTHPNTRHLLYLQIKQDMYKGRLECQNVELLYRIAGLALQAEIGDFSAQRCGLTYVSDFELIPVLTRSTEEAISHLHRQNRGRLSGECETELLDIVQELPSYGTISYSVQDSSRQGVTLCISPDGIKVLQRSIERASFEWDSIESITTRGKAMTFHISASHTLAPYQVQYFCQSSSLVHNIATHCQYLLENYCIAVAEVERPKSRLKRWFSSRRSFRRRPSPMRRHFKDSNGQTRRVVNGRRASFGGDLTSPPMTTVTASSRMSLRATSRTDSKLVIYGSGGLASPAHTPAQATPNHHTLKLETHLTEQVNSSPSSGATPTHKITGATPPHRGSIGDVEHKSLSSVLKSHTQTSPTTGATRRTSTASSGAGDGERRRSFIQEVGSPTKNMVMYGSSREDKQLTSPKHNSTSNVSFNPRKLLNDYQLPPKREWYHDDMLSPSEKRSFSELPREKAVLRSGSTSEVSTPSRTTGQRYLRHDSAEPLHTYTHSSSTEHFSAARGGSHVGRFEHSQSVDHIERAAAPSNKRRHHHHTHNTTGESSLSRQTGQTRSSRSSSDISARRKKSSSLPRDTPPKLDEEDEPAEGQSTSKYGRHHAAKPQNRGRFRLSLPESSYHDIKLASRQSNARRSRRALTDTSLSGSGSLSQPNDFGLGGLSSKLGSIASLEYQASFAELSQSDITSVIDPHTRSFIFEGSQTTSQGTAL